MAEKKKKIDPTKIIVKGPVWNFRNEVTPKKPIGKAAKKSAKKS